MNAVLNDEGLPMMELWISRAAVETVARAAATLLDTIVPSDYDPDLSTDIKDALKSIREAVADAWEDPLDTTPL